MQRRGQETQKWTLKGLGTYQLPVDLYAVVTERQFSLSERKIQVSLITLCQILCKGLAK